MVTLKKVMETNVWHKFPLLKAIAHWKKNEEMRSKIRDLIRSVTNKPDDNDKKYIKVKFNPDAYLPLKNAKTL